MANIGGVLSQYRCVLVTHVFPEYACKGCGMFRIDCSVQQNRIRKRQQGLCPENQRPFSRRQRNFQRLHVFLTKPQPVILGIRRKGANIRAFLTRQTLWMNVKSLKA
eukprot:CAMPEP_0118952040 /NCGR_PEP_ID=MMETSP1169-20130426/54134_1 /TAXON_ID=36882 /ORGANISM="Pyramimonas obovata, Strain CCMP722" /LENGTH=106 /DNA_ID=CAMNT_0006899201 /DNA_START=605 /DNA_END=925 /DNA_ORIENTATION=+